MKDLGRLVLQTAGGYFEEAKKMNVDLPIGISLPHLLKRHTARYLNPVFRLGETPQVRSIKGFQDLQKLGRFK